MAQKTGTDGDLIQEVAKKGKVDKLNFRRNMGLNLKSDPVERNREFYSSNDMMLPNDRVKMGIAALNPETSTTQAGLGVPNSIIPIETAPADQINTPSSIQNPTSIVEDPAKKITGKKAAPIREQLVKNFQQHTGQQLSPADEKAVMDQLRSQKSQNKAVNAENPNISQAFTGALLGLLPTLAGALFGGDEGTAIGANVGIQAMDQYGNAIQQEKQSAFQQQKFEADQALEQQKLDQQATLAQYEFGNKKELAEDKFKNDMFLQNMNIQSNAQLDRIKQITGLNDAKFEKSLKLNAEFHRDNSLHEKAVLASKEFDNAYAMDLNGPNSVALINKAFKVLDPNSTVREGEFATLEQAQAWSLKNPESLPAIGGLLRKSTGSKITPEMATQLKGLVDSQTIVHKEQQRIKAFSVVERGAQLGLSEDDIFGTTRAIDLLHNEDKDARKQKYIQYKKMLQK